MSNIPIRAAEHPERVWEAQRQLFTRLYKEEKMKLPEVQRLMKDEHGFYASERQYKRRIKKWKLEKNSKADEKTHALALLQGFETRLDLTCIYKLNGKDIAAHKLLRHARSRGIEPSDIVPEIVDRRCRSSLGRTECIARSQDSELYYRSEPMDSFDQILDDIGNFMKLALQNSFFLKKINMKSKWEERSGTTVDNMDVMQRELFSRLINSFTPYPEATRTLLKILLLFWKCLRSSPVEPPRVIEIPGGSLGHQLDIRLEAPDVEIQDIDYTDTSSITPHSSHIIQDYEVSDNSGLAGNNFSDSEIRYHSLLSAGNLPSNGSEALDVAPTSPSDDAPELKINELNQDRHNVASMQIDSHAFSLTDSSLATVPHSPPFPTVLTMELSPPLVLPDEYMHLTWKPFDSFEIPEGVTPDLETFLDSSLWEDSWDTPQFDQNSDSLFELVDEGDTSPPPAGAQKRLR